MPRFWTTYARRWNVLAAAGILAAAGLVALAQSSTAQTTTSDVAVTGYVAGGETLVSADHLVAFTFTETNRGPGAGTASVDLTMVSLSGATVVDMLCVFPNHHGFNADSPACEPGALAVHQSATQTVIVEPAGTGVISIRACTSNEAANPPRDPNTANNCKTLHVRTL